MNPSTTSNSVWHRWSSAAFSPNIYCPHFLQSSLWMPSQIAPRNASKEEFLELAPYLARTIADICARKASSITAHSSSVPLFSASSNVIARRKASTVDDPASDGLTCVLDRTVQPLELSRASPIHGVGSISAELRGTNSPVSRTSFLISTNDNLDVSASAIVVQKMGDWNDLLFLALLPVRPSHEGSMTIGRGIPIPGTSSPVYAHDAVELESYSLASKKIEPGISNFETIASSDGPLLAHENSQWCWMYTAVNTSAVGSRGYLDGNMAYIFETRHRQRLPIDDLVNIMYAYGVDLFSARYILGKLDPKRCGYFDLTAKNMSLITNGRIHFFEHSQRDLINLRDASKCFRKNLLSLTCYAGYIMETLQKRHNYDPFFQSKFGLLKWKPPFMLLGLHGIMGLWKFSSIHLLTKDVETFMGILRVFKPDDAQRIINLINDDYKGKISFTDFFILANRWNWLGKHGIEMLDIDWTHDLSLFFTFMDKDEDGYLSASDLELFAAIFGSYRPSNETITMMTSKLDWDGDGKISREDFYHVMRPALSGLTWEFWLVAILLTLEL